MVTLAAGLEVKIQRTNGAIHRAQITGVDFMKKVVTVEWNEGEDIKGKEVDIDMIYQLNPTVNPNTNSNNGNVNEPFNSTMLVNKAVNGNSSSVSPRRDNDRGHFKVPTQIANPNSNSNANTNANSNGSMRMRIQNRSTAKDTISENERPSGSSAIGKLNMTHSTPSTYSNLPKASNSQSVIPTSSKITSKARQSTALKEVEKIKKQREERRARQAEQRAEKHELMSASDVNATGAHQQWEFLSMIRDYRDALEMKPIQISESVIDQQICVAVRKRPLNKREESRKDCDVITIPSKDVLIVHEGKTKVDLTKYLENHRFRFDYSFDESADNQLVYHFTARPLVKTIFDGGMATCFAYGQTGSGKTHTMGGNFHGKTQDSSKGIYALAAKDVFALLKIARAKTKDDLFLCSSYFEIYSGKVFDLLNGKEKLRVLEDAKSQVQIVGLSEKRIESVDDVLKLIQTGNNIRTSGTTSANNHSSRSHAVFQIILKEQTRNGASKMIGKFSLIDLAGNERGADTLSANRQTRMEGAEINKSLLALKECIRALGRKGAHLPFRQSKLTHVLRDSFIGEKSRTCMIAMISPGFQSCENTLNTLRYANRVKELGTNDSEQSRTDEENDEMDEEYVNYNEMSASNDELFKEDKFEVLNKLEDELLDEHKAFCRNMIRWQSITNNLVQISSEVGYDFDEYSNVLTSSHEEMMEAMHALNEKHQAVKVARDELLNF